MNRRGRTALLVSAGLAFAFVLTGCEDAEAVAKAEAAAKAKAAEAEKASKLKEKVAHNVDCLSALRWQKAALGGAGIGDLKLYEEHYRTRLDAAVGDTMVEGEDGAPILSRSTMQDYLDWSYTHAVATKLAAGKDANSDGTVSGAERSGRGFNMVSACVLEVAEAGKGPLAGKDKVARMYKIEALRGKLKDKGA